MQKLLGMSLLSLVIFLGVVIFFKKSASSSSEVVEVAAKPLVEESVVPAAKEEVEVGLEPMQDTIADEEVDQISRFFTKGKQAFPIVQTIKYRSRVPWLKGKNAWIADYASHYKTSRHFIARSLNQKPDYLTQKVGAGDTFNVLSLEKTIHFYLVIDLSRCKMRFYYHDLDADERVLIKTYRVGLGRLDLEAESGALTPTGQYLLGDKIATYKPGVVSYFQGVETEMVRIFGTRWIPFVKEVNGEGDCRGLGLHGLPWLYDEKKEIYVEDRELIGSYASDGCIRLTREDIEEIYAIVITRPTIVEIVTDFQEATLPKLKREDASAKVRGDNHVGS